MGRSSQENLEVFSEVGDQRLQNTPSSYFHEEVDWQSPSNFTSKRFPRDRFVCISSITLDVTLRCMETRSSESCNKCISTEISTKNLFAFPSFCMIPKFLNKTLREKVQKAILITPAWKTQVWYAKILSMSIKSLILLAWRKYLLKNSKGDIHVLVYNNTLQLARLQEMRISDSDFNFISKSKWPSLNGNHEWNFKKWASWCPRKKTDSFPSNANEILDNFILFI